MQSTSNFDYDRIAQLIKDNRLSEAYNQLKGRLAQNPELAASGYEASCNLIKALSLSGNFKASDEILQATLKTVSPKDDHFFLKLSDELVELSEFNPLSRHENTSRHDRMFDQSLMIRKELVGADIPAAELIIDSIFSNLQRARQLAASALASEAAGRLTRCRSLLEELQGLMGSLPHPPELLAARVFTMQAFFEQSAGQKNIARQAYLKALEKFSEALKKSKLERSDIFDMFIDQGQLYNLTTEERVAFEKLKKAKLAPQNNQTMHRIKAFPDSDNIQEMMQRAASKPGKTFYLTSLGFSGNLSLLVSAVCHKDTGEMTFTIEPSTESGGRDEKLIIHTVDTQEVLRHIKDLWRALQTKPQAFGASALAGMNANLNMNLNMNANMNLSMAASDFDKKGQDPFTMGGSFDTLNSNSSSGGFVNQPISVDLQDQIRKQEFQPKAQASGGSRPETPTPSPSSQFDLLGKPELLGGDSFNSAKSPASNSASRASGSFGASSRASGERDPGESPVFEVDKHNDHRVNGPPVGYAAQQERRHRETLIFEGNLKTMPSLGLLQTIALNDNTGVLEVSGKDGMMSIYFDNGKPVHASSLKDSGLEVLYDFIIQEEGWFRFLPEQRAPQVTLKVRFQSFLLEAATLFDENKYLKSLGLTMYSALMPKEFCSDKDEFRARLEGRGIEWEDCIWDLFIALCESPIVTDAVELADLPKHIWLHALYRLVQAGMVNISNDGMDVEDIAARLTTKWAYNKQQADDFSAKLHDTRTGLYRFEFLIWLIEREFERARTQMWPLSIAILEIRKHGKLPSQLSLEDKEAMHMALAEIVEAKRSIDWFTHFEEEHFALLMPGLDSNLAAMFVSNFSDICTRHFGKLKEGHSDWDYSFGIACVPGDTFEWQKMVGFAIEAQRKARVSRRGFELHKQESKQENRAASPEFKQGEA